MWSKFPRIYGFQHNFSSLSLRPVMPINCLYQTREYILLILPIYLSGEKKIGITCCQASRSLNRLLVTFTKPVVVSLSKGILSSRTYFCFEHKRIMILIEIFKVVNQSLSFMLLTKGYCLCCSPEVIVYVVD